jgi:hypothetical protein
LSFNAFVLPKKINNIKEVRVCDIKAAFPFNATEYHFRFQTRMGNMKVWIDTSRDTVGVPHIDGNVKMKLLKLPKGVKPKQSKIVPQSSYEKIPDPSFTKNSYSEPLQGMDKDHLSPSKAKHIHLSNSQNNLLEHNSKEFKKNGHKPSSQLGDHDLIGDMGDDGHHSVENNYNMDFNINTDEIFGGGDAHKQPNESTKEQQENLLGDFETTHHTNEHSQPPPANNDFYLGGLGDLGGVDFSMVTKKPEEEVKKPDEPISLSDHVANVHKTSEKEKVEWEEAYRKYDNKIKIWKGMPVQNSIKVLL